MPKGAPGAGRVPPNGTDYPWKFPRHGLVISNVMRFAIQYLTDVADEQSVCHAFDADVGTIEEAESLAWRTALTAYHLHGANGLQIGMRAAQFLNKPDAIAERCVASGRRIVSPTSGGERRG